MEVISASFVN